MFGACNSSKDQPGTGKIENQISGKWINVGPGGGGAVFEATVNPVDPQHVFIRCDMTGSYVSEDGGESWRTFNLRTTINDFEFDPNDPFSEGQQENNNAADDNIQGESADDGGISIENDGLSSEE